MQQRPGRRRRPGDGRRVDRAVGGRARPEGTDQTEDVRTTKTGESTHVARSGQPATSLSCKTGSMVSLGLTTYTRISSARPHSGTRCSRFAFIRAAEIVRTRPAVSISAHVASRTSPDRPAVSTSQTPAGAADARTVATAAATSLWGSAIRCCTSRSRPQVRPPSVIGQSASHSEPTRAKCICGTVRGHRYNRSTINKLFTST